MKKEQKATRKTKIVEAIEEAAVQNSAYPASLFVIGDISPVFTCAPQTYVSPNYDIVEQP